MPRPVATGSSPSPLLKQTLNDPSVKDYTSEGKTSSSPASTAASALASDVRDASRVNVPTK